MTEATQITIEAARKILRRGLRGGLPMQAEEIERLRNCIDALTRRLQEAAEERDRYRASLERIHLRAATGPGDRNFDRCIQDLMWCDDEARLALTERSK